MATITNQEIRTIRKMVQRAAAAVEPMAKEKFGNLPSDMIKGMIAQNVLRDCMAVVFNELSPHGVALPAEIAIRMASYALSNAPIEDQERLMEFVVERLPEVHRERISSGIALQSEWETDGVSRPNIATGKDRN